MGMLNAGAKTALSPRYTGVDVLADSEVPFIVFAVL